MEAKTLSSKISTNYVFATCPICQKENQLTRTFFGSSMGKKSTTCPHFQSRYKLPNGRYVIRWKTAKEKS